eukprot:TRINITY_DN27160_c0_g1_i1.p1 TRINITY_DN27160_c0_g1~~TRINITY_DN27160_c0_g1_i1.p1  ORF type:complete len:125 (-),score=14.57 TRINITY_DN27160_c0_g1_i1:178-552(-)
MATPNSWKNEANKQENTREPIEATARDEEKGTPRRLTPSIIREPTTETPEQENANRSLTHQAQHVGQVQRGPTMKDHQPTTCTGPPVECPFRTKSKGAVNKQVLSDRENTKSMFHSKKCLSVRN